MSSKFKEAYSRLNERQKKAVTAIDGPVLVIAGPGTGKTQLLSMRVANILQSTDTNPNNILCLTYTNKAAVNMKERIIELAGPGGSRIPANTFHGFAAEIMNLYPDYFWNAARLSVAPDALQLEIVESIVRELPLDNPLALKFAGQYTLLSDIAQAIKLAKEAGLTPDKLRALLNVNIAYIDEIEDELVTILSPALSFKKLGSLSVQIDSLPKQAIDRLVYPLASLSTVMQGSLKTAIKEDGDSGKTVSTGRWKSRWVQTVSGQRAMFKERQRNAWWLELANVYGKYRGALHQRGYYDYADMLVETLSQLEQNPEILADIQERYSYVLLDEFQDTTPAQLRLAHLVADHHSAEGKPNLMAVGDDDQSIYKFNGAELNNMLGFKRSYPSAKVIILKDNYRSRQEILDAASKIIEQAQSRLVRVEPSLSKNLRAVSPPKAKGQIKALSYSSSELQLSEIAREIKRRYTPKRRIAVLARGHASLIRMASILQTLKVPVRYEQQANILEHEMVHQVYLLAKLLLAIQSGDRQAANGLIHGIIRWPAWGLTPKQLWELARTNYPDKDWLDSLLSSKSAQLKALGEWFIWLAREQAGQPLAVTIEQMLGLRASGNFLSPVKKYFLGATGSDANKYFHGLSAIQLLRALVHEFGEESEPSLAELVRFFEINQDNGKIVADESPFITGKAAVAIMSVHKAKGLEFDEVYIIDAVEGNWRPKNERRRPPANLPLQPAGDDFDDYVRLMYVAATRAKSSLVISAYHLDHSGKDVAVSSIVQGALKVVKIDEADPRKLVTILEENLRWPSLSGGLEKEMLKARLEDYNLSVTHLLNFLDIEKGGPQYFKERNLLRLPEAKTPSLAYGTAMHAAMETAQILTNKGRFSLREVKDRFSRSLKQEQLPPDQFARYQGKGFRTLGRLFSEFKYRIPRGSTSEQKLKGVTVGKAQISGKLDRVDEDGEGLRIVDYKTGSPLSSFLSRDKTKALKAHRHKLQLIFYATLLEAKTGRKASGAIEGQMVYLEAPSREALVKSYVPTSDDIDHLRRLIEAVWLRITSYELPDASAYTPDLEGTESFETDLIASNHSS